MKTKTLKKSIINYSIIIIGLILLFVIFHVISGGTFLTSVNIRAVLSHTAVTTCMALAMCFIFISGTIDLSLGAILILSSNCAGILAVRFGYPGMIIGGIGSAILMCLANNEITQRLQIPSWIASLGTAMIYESIAYAYSSHMNATGSTIVKLGDVCREIGTMPLLMILEVILVVIAYIIFNRTITGVNIRALADGPGMVSMLGINAKKTLMLAAVLAGVFMGCAAMFNESIANSVQSSTGLGSLASVFRPIAVYFMAQSLTKRINLIPAVLITSIAIMGLLNFLTMIGVPAGTAQEIVLGVCIWAFAVISRRGFKEVVK